MKKNRTTTIDLKHEIRRMGNWNYKNGSPPVYTKPIAEIILDGDRFVWKHEEILELIRIYMEVDEESIEMIKNGKAGEVNNFEMPLLEKIQKFIDENKKSEVKKFSETLFDNSLTKELKEFIQ